MRRGIATAFAVATLAGVGVIAAPSPASAAPSRTATVNRCYVGRPVSPAYLRFLLKQRPAQCHVYGPVTVNQTWR